MKTFEFAAGSVIFRQGQKGAMMYFVKSGKVGIYVNYGENGEKLLVEEKTGDHFGEMAIIDDVPRSATAVATENTVVLGIEKDSFDEFLKEQPNAAIEIMTTLSARLRAVTDDLMEACKAISENMGEQEKGKKQGILARLKKFADMYSDSINEAYAAGYSDPGDYEKFFAGQYVPLRY